MVLPLVILKISLEDKLLIKYFVIKHLILLKIQNMIDTKEALLQQFINVFVETSATPAANTSGSAIKNNTTLNQ